MSSNDRATHTADDMGILDGPIGSSIPPRVIDPAAQAEIDNLRERLRTARAQLWTEWERGSAEARRAFERTAA